MSAADERARVDAVARSWVDTPYHHLAGIKGVGVDCAQLLRCVYVEAGLIADFKTGFYPQQWMLHRDEERFIGFVRRYAEEIPEEQAAIGDIVLYRLGRCWSHGAIIVAPGWPHAVVHAHMPAARVMLTGGRDGELGDKARKPRFFSRWR